MTANEPDHGGAPRRARLPAAERRETILRAAAAVFAESGYRAAKVSDVAARVGVTEPVIFQNFGSKAALFAAVVARAAADARDALDELAARPGPPTGLLAHILASPATGEQEHAAPPARTRPDDPAHPASAFSVLFADAAVLAAEPELAAPARDAVRAAAGHLADLVRHAQAHGGARPDADPEAAAWLLLSVLAARRLRATAMPGGLEPAVTALALGALAPPPADIPGRGQAPRAGQAAPAPDPPDAPEGGRSRSLPVTSGDQ